MIVSPYTLPQGWGAPALTYISFFNTKTASTVQTLKEDGRLGA